MLKITVLGLVLTAIALSGIMSAASAETAPSPLQQVRDGVPTDEVMCSENRVLMVSQIGMPACAFAGSAEMLERRGFILPSWWVPCDDLLAKQPEVSEKPSRFDSPDASKTGDRPFVTTWRTTSPNEPITIPVGNATCTYTVDWGDGGISTNVTGDQTHAYKDAGTYTVTITGNFERIYLNDDQINAPKLQSIEQWGDVPWASMGSAFYGASNMVYNAADVPDLSGVTDTSHMFDGATSFNSDLSSWDVSGVTDTTGMFSGATSFNSDLSGWDVSSVTYMARHVLGRHLLQL